MKKKKTKIFLFFLFFLFFFQHKTQKRVVSFTKKGHFNQNQIFFDKVCVCVGHSVPFTPPPEAKCLLVSCLSFFQKREKLSYFFFVSF